MNDNLLGLIFVSVLLGIGVAMGVPIGRLTTKSTQEVGEEVVVKGYLEHCIRRGEYQIDKERYVQCLFRFADRQPVEAWIDEKNPVAIHTGAYQEFVGVPMKNKVKDKDGLLIVRNFCPVINTMQKSQWTAMANGYTTDYFKQPETDGCPEEALAPFMAQYYAEQDEEMPLDADESWLPAWANIPEPIVYNTGE